MNMHSFVDARQSVGYLESSGANLSQSLKRLSTGIKVEGAGDAGGLAVSSKLDSAIARSLALGANVQNGMSFLEAQDAAQTRLGGILTRMSELRQRYDDPIRNLGDGAKLNREFKHLQEEIRSLGQKKFNGISLFSNGSHQDSKLVIETDGVSRPISGEITRNIFFESILANQNTGGAIGASVTTQGALGSFGATGITPAGGATADQTVNGASGTTPNQTVNATSGTTPDQTVNGASGTTPNQTVSGSAGTTPSQTVNGLQGTTPNQTVNGTAGGSAANQVINAPQGTTPAQTINAAQGTTVGLVSISAPAGPGGSGTSFNLTPASGTTAAALWTQTFAGGTNGFEKMSPVFDSNGDIFVGLNEHDEIRKLSAADGSTLQTYDLTDALLGTGNNKSWKVAVSSDTLYAANGDTKQLIAFDKATGVQKAGWPQTLGTAGYATAENPPFVHSNGNVYVASNGPGFSFINSGRIFGFAPDGSQLFSPINVDGQFEGGFAEAADGTLIATGKGGTFNHRSLIAFNPTTGAELWHKTAGNPSGFNPRGIGSSIIGPPAILGTSVVINDDEDETRAFDVATGNELWSIDIGHDMKGGPTVANVGGTDTVFVASSNGVVALRDSGTATPTTVWTSPVLDAENCTPVYDSNQNRVYVTDDATGKVIALNAADGTQVWDIDIGTPGDPSLASPAIDSNGNIYVGDNNGEFTAITPWEAPVADGIGSGFSTAPALSDVVLDPTAPNLGTLQVASVALNTGPAPPAGSLRITFTGSPTGPADIGVTVAGGGGGGGGTPPAVGPVGSGYQLGETPAARVIAEGIGAKTASLKTGLVTLIDGDTAPPAGPGTITDSSGSGNNGTVAAGQEPNHEVTDRRSGTGSYTFDGTNDKINLGTLNAQIGGQDKLTISAWVSHAATGDDRIVCKSPSTNVADHVFSLGIANDNMLRMRIGTDTTNATNMAGTTAIPNDGTWTHVAMTYDGTNVKSYVNGALDSTHTLSGNVKTSADNVYIGNVNGAQNRHFLGKLDDVGIWNRALTSSEIGEIAGPGNLTATASVNDGTDPLKPAGTLTVTPVGTTAIAGDFKVEVDNGTPYLTNLSSIGSGYDGGPPAEAAPTVTITGADVGTASGTATVNADGTLNVAFSGTPAGVGNLNVSVANGVARTPAGLTGVANPANLYDPAEAAPVVTITGADKGTLVGTAAIQPDGNVNVSFTGTPTGSGPLTVSIANGLNNAPASLTGIGSGYDGGPPAEVAPTVTITGADKGTLAGTATVKADGTLDIAFSGNPSGLGNITVAIANGVAQKPANLAGIGSGYTVGDPAPAVTFVGANAGTLAATSSINPDGTLNITFTGAPTDTANVTMNVANGPGGVASLTGIGSGYTVGDPVPTVTVTGANAGTLAGTASINANGTLDVTFTGNPTDSNNVTVQIADGVIRVGNFAGIGSGYVVGDPVPTVTVTGANAGTLAGTTSINANGTLDLAFTGSPTDKNNVTVQIADGVNRVANLTGIGSGYVVGDPAPAVTVTGANAGTLAATSSINANGTLDLTLTGNPTEKNNVTVQIADGLARVPNLTGVGSGYDPSEPPPAVTITGATKNTLAGTASINANGTLDIAFTGNPSDFTNLTVQAANGALRAPATLTGLGANQDPASPPAVTISGADKGTLAGTANVNPDGTVDVSFSGAPTGNGPLNVQFAGAGGGGASLISNQYLLDMNGDLWDYSVAEFESFTELVADARAQNGAEQNSLNTFWNLITTNANKLQAASGRIKDADYAKEMTKLSKNKILNQSAAIMLGKQNRITSEALLTIQRLNNTM